MREAPGIVEKLPPDRLIEAELVAKIGEALGRHDVLAGPHLDWVAGHEPDRDESQEHQRQKGRDGQRNAAKEVSEHGRSKTNGPALSQRARTGLT